MDFNELRDKHMREQEQAALAESFAKLSDDELQKQRIETDKKLVALRLEFPKWQIQTQSPAYSEIRRLEKERECIILELTKRGLPTHKPKPKLPEPVHTVSTGFTSVSLPKAPASPREVGGLGLAPYSPKPLRMPSRPDDFPGDLWPRAVVILSKAIQRFRDQDHLSELCEHLTVEMTPLYCEAVETGKTKAGSVLNDGSGMEELLRLLLAANDPGPSSWGLSNQAWEILQAVKTATWGKLAEAIEEAQRFRTGAKQAELSRAQNSGKTTQSADRKPTDGADDMTRKAVLMPLLSKKNFSVHDWANEAGVDWHTADDYLNGKTKPYQSTLGKLARALDIKVEDMPA